MSLQPERRYGPRTSIDRVVDALASVGVTYRVTGDHVQASCPVHGQDRHPSLSIDYRDGKVWLHCQTCFDDDAIVEALGLTWADMYDEKPPEQQQLQRPLASRRKKPAPKRLGPLPARLLTPPEPEPVTDWQVVTTYDYHDAEGQLVAQAVRSERDEADPQSAEVQRVKRFTQRWPDPAGGWLTKMPHGYTPVLYRLPAVRAAIEAGQPVWLLEGEKDADATIDAGAAAATTNPAGASNFADAHAAQLAGADVNLVIDLDRAGWSRAVNSHKLLTKHGATIRILTPAVEGKGADATDHLEAGHGLDDYIEVTVDEAAVQVALADLEAHAKAAREALNEAEARLARAQETTAAKARETETRYARRWAAEAGRRVVRAEAEYRRLDNATAGPLADRIQTAFDDTREHAARAYEITGAEMAADVRALYGEPDTDSKGSGFKSPLGQADGDVAPDNVVDHPTSSRLPDPRIQIPMARGAWRYDLGGEGRPARGVYAQIQNRWVRIGPLPYVRARIIRRDGSGRRCGTDYLLAGTEDGPGVIVDHQGLRDGSWANELGLSLSDDDKIMRATSTAIRVHSDDIPEREETPRVDASGRIAVPVAETLPDGYLATAPTDREDALAAWKKIIDLAALSPNLALTLGAAAAAPYVGALNRQSHIVSLYGDASEGKTTTIRAAGAIYGDSATEDGGVITRWNASGIGVIRSLGRLGCLPAFYDEQGMAGIEGPAAWGKVIYDITEGAQRITAESRGTGVRRTKPWYGIFFSTANGRLVDGLGSGKFAGIGRRVIELGTPLTTSAAHAEAIEPLLSEAYGHIGAAILERYDTAAVNDLIGRVDSMLPLPEEGNARTIAKHLQLHLAGALMLDELAGAGATCFSAALEAACDYLDQYAPPEHDAERILRQIRDAIAREPAMWPTVDEYRAHREPAGWGEDGDPRNRLPAHGVNRSLSGIRADDGSWVAVFAEPWRTMADGEGIDSTVALRELHRRGVLLVTTSRRRRGEWKTEIRTTGTSMYKLALPEPEDDEPDEDDAPTNNPETDESGPDGDGWGSRWGSVGGGVGGSENALTCDVGGVGGVGGQNPRVPARERTNPTEAADSIDQPTTEADPPAPSDEEAEMPKPERPCVVCGKPTIGYLDGQPVHLADCAPELENRAGSAARSEPLPLPPDDEPTTAPEAAQRPTRPPDSGTPAVVADVDGVWLPDGTQLDLPDRERFAQDLLDLAYDHGIGWRTKAVREGPHVYITRGLAAELGALLEPLSDEREEADKALARHGEQLDWLAPDEQAWTTNSQLGAWLTWRHPDKGRARMVFLPYCTGQRELAMAADDPDPAALARRLRAYAQLTGIPYRITAATTGLDLMHSLRPRAKAGRTTTRVTALEKPVEMPPPVTDEQLLDAEVYWLRRPLGDEADHQYLHWYDRNGQYLAAANRVYLGADVDPEHHPDGGVEIDQKRPGFVLVPAPTKWDDWRLPNPWDPLGDPDRVLKQRWLPTTFASWLLELDVELEIAEAWLWPQSAAYLDPWVKVLREARHTIELHRAENPDANAVRPDLKLTYSAGLGKLADQSLLRRDGDRMRSKYRPDWYSLIRGKSRANIQRLIVATGDRSGRWPVAVREDAVAYTSNDPDPVSAWPGDPSKLDDPNDSTPGKLGDMKPYKSGRLADVADLLRQQPHPITTRKILTAMTDAAEWDSGS